MDIDQLPAHLELLNVEIEMQQTQTRSRLSVAPLPTERVRLTSRSAFLDDAAIALLRARIALQQNALDEAKRETSIATSLLARAVAIDLL